MSILITRSHEWHCHSEPSEAQGDNLFRIYEMACNHSLIASETIRLRGP